MSLKTSLKMKHKFQSNFLVGGQPPLTDGVGFSASIRLSADPDSRDLNPGPFSV